MMLALTDDGTLDTVLLCSECGEFLRYSEIERDENGPTEAALAEAEEQHADECGGSLLNHLKEK